MGTAQSCGSTACCGDSNSNEVKGLGAKTPGMAAPGLRSDAPVMEAPMSQHAYHGRPQGELNSQYEVPTKSVDRDSGLVLGFRLLDGSKKNLLFGLRHRPPLGMDFTKTEPVAVKRVKQSSPAEELGVQVGWEVFSVNGELMVGKTPKEVFQAMKSKLTLMEAMADYRTMVDTGAPGRDQN
mmetsp:Transcript_59923/g.135147  ORF Transcript_59923/g.135147 Transcript_59923/m.135147 type:complete len:181 (-) Transcript_59923:100-642(-)|eukprot:CAMPEP_0197893206 /NCGR_PEP_ID=MMETSP1439-20131203/32634_1 /TAXON_ID=66791 /ORGANISM="Gonyaulax spinifera, Strain CCMP409" /LENGTH=180 /DNA_ID=CAMNT_0043513463 /DNA_START=34 /DNA_END=576 /DNA_ORIENTATION=+